MDEAKNRSRARRARRRRGLLLGLVLGVAMIVGFAALRAWDPTPLQIARLKVFDFYQQIRPRDDVQRSVMIVDIDEKSLRSLGHWPWPRTQIGEMVEKITEAGAIAIGFDAIFAEPDRMSPATLALGAPQLDLETRAALARMPTNDEMFARSIRRSRVVLGQSGVRDDARRASEGPATPISTLGPDPLPFVVKFPRLLRNVSDLEDAAAGRGLVSLGLEPDAIVRRVPSVAAIDGALSPTLAIELLRVAVGADSLITKATPEGMEGVIIGDFFAPTDRQGMIWVHFAPHDRSRYISASDVLAGVGLERLENKLVLVGTSAVGLLDIKATPLDGALPGVEVHAQLVETLIAGAGLARPSYALGLELAAAVVIGLGIVLLVPQLGAAWVLAIGAAAAAGVVAVSWIFYVDHRVLLDPSYPLLSNFAVLASLAFLNYLRDEREKDQIRGAFGRYLAPDVVERLAENPEQLTLGGETRDLTVLFTDVRGFTTISESFRDDPQGLTQLMNRMLTPLSNAIIERRGTIDKYIGDAIMAFWNAPIDVSAHPKIACEAALDMNRRLAELNAARAEEDAAQGRAHLPLRIGIGINTGTCVVGNMGSDLRFSYSALGDPVNLAARLEGQTVTYGAEILIGDATARACGTDFAIVEVDLLRVKGKVEPSPVHMLLGDGEMAADARFAETRGAVGEVVRAFRAQDWDGAAAYLSKLRAQDQAAVFAGVADLYERRIAAFRAAPPPADWDGAVVATAK